MITKAQDNFIDPGLSDTWCKPMILNKGMTGIGIARRYWLFFYIEEPIYPSVYHVFGGCLLLTKNCNGKQPQTYMFSRLAAISDMSFVIFARANVF